MLSTIMIWAAAAVLVCCGVVVLDGANARVPEWASPGVDPAAARRAVATAVLLFAVAVVLVADHHVPDGIDGAAADAYEWACRALSFSPGR